MKKRYYLLAALATVLFACNKDVTLLTPDEVGKVAVVDDTNPAKEDEGDPEEATDPVETTDPVENTEVGDATEDLVPILLGTSFSADAATTRTESTTYQATELIDGSAVGVYIYKTGNKDKDTDSYGYHNIAYTSNSISEAGDLSLVTAADQPYYPSLKTQKIDIYAFSPRSITTATTKLSEQAAVSFNITADQSTDANYKASDFIWGANTSTVNAESNRNSKVAVPLQHMGSKIIVNLREGHGMAGKLAGADVQIKGQIEGTVNLTTGAMTGGGTDAAVYLAKTLASGTTTAPTGFVLDPTNYSSEDALDHKFYSCAGIIYPAVVNNSATDNFEFITITLADGTSGTTGGTQYKYKVSGKIPNDTGFEAGEVYTYNITVNATGIDLTTTITNWDSSPSAVAGNATF